MSQRQTYRILLVDDQETIHEDYRKILGQQPTVSSAVSQAAAALFGDEPQLASEWEGFDLDSALQGEEGFRLVQRSMEEGHPYAMAFVDIRMPPGWDGIKTVRKMWEVDPEILIVICSAYSDYSWEDMVRQLGRNDRFLILKKPFDNIEVRQCAMALTERWSVSRTDVLTGLLNRRAFHGHFTLEWDRATRHQFPVACAMVDLDYFKRINDTLGHQVGDLVLKSVATQLQSNCRASDYLCRYGGEELCVLLPHTNEEGAAAWAEHARRAIETTGVTVGDRTIQVTASFGVAGRLCDGDDMDKMIDRADQALMVAKKLGRNQVVGYAAISETRQVEANPQASNIFHNVVARHLMTAPMACFHKDTPIGDAAEFFLQFRINSAPVVAANDQLVGIVSEKDVISVLHSADAWNMTIENIMQRNVVCYEEETPAQMICDFLARVAVRRVVIVRDGRPTGVVSRGSLLRWFVNWHVSHRGASVPRETSDQGRDRLMRGAEAVARTAAQLCQRVSTTTEDPVYPMIDQVSKLQELINDLLTSWHYANLPAVVDDEAYAQATNAIHESSTVID